ncbi:dipeptidase [Pueribacillus sp. YX66]|uniref:dipeptidase n=1 Tax=Pueribacillus sp. YX66 TaxID=3229242 RepID=UPI00358D4A9B
MKIFDAHCDVLYKMWMNPKVSFYNDLRLHTNYANLKQTGSSNIQCFAIYVPSHVHEQERFQVALEMINIFYEKIMTCRGMKFISSKSDALRLQANEIGAILTLEGCDAIGNDLIRLKTLYRLGVRSIGLTWNYANAVADGILERRGAGLTSFGERVVTFNNEKKLWTDVSHLSEQGFWDVIELAQYPIASHSNAKTVTPHVRNLTDNQILALIQRNGMIGVTFVPEFLEKKGNATVYDVLRHIEYICSLGGENNIGLGSDFDGIEQTPYQLWNYSYYSILINELLKKYPERIVKGFLSHNFLEKMFF